jgi:hypothetical protein
MALKVLFIAFLHFCVLFLCQIKKDYHWLKYLCVICCTCLSKQTFFWMCFFSRTIKIEFNWVELTCTKKWAEYKTSWKKWVCHVLFFCSRRLLCNNYLRFFRLSHRCVLVLISRMKNSKTNMIRGDDGKWTTSNSIRSVIVLEW